MDLLLRVQVVEPLEDLLQHGGNLSLVKWTRPQLCTHTTSDDIDMNMSATRWRIQAGRKLNIEIR